MGDIRGRRMTQAYTTLAIRPLPLLRRQIGSDSCFQVQGHTKYLPLEPLEPLV
jgi:hypothetical protein